METTASITGAGGGVAPEARHPRDCCDEAANAATLAACLRSDAAGWIRRRIIGRDGGFSATRPFVRV